MIRLLFSLRSILCIFSSLTVDSYFSSICLNKSYLLAINFSFYYSNFASASFVFFSSITLSAKNWSYTYFLVSDFTTVLSSICLNWKSLVALARTYLLSFLLSWSSANFLFLSSNSLWILLSNSELPVRQVSPNFLAMNSVLFSLISLNLYAWCVLGLNTAKKISLYYGS